MSKDLKSLFLAHRRELQAYLTTKLRDAETAADLTQQAFLRYAEYRHGGGAAVLNDRSFLYRTANNLAIDHVRQHARRQTDIVANDELAQALEHGPSLEEVTDSHQALDRLRAAVEELPERTRAIFVLNRIEDLTYREVAERLGISESSVQKHLARALRHVMTRQRAFRAD